jgi:hypothetical protein
MILDTSRRFEIFPESWHGSGLQENDGGVNSPNLHLRWRTDGEYPLMQCAVHQYLDVIHTPSEQEVPFEKDMLVGAGHDDSTQWNAGGVSTPNSQDR